MGGVRHVQNGTAPADISNGRRSVATKYSYQCPNQSYAISLEMCLARRLRGGCRCRRCRSRPAEDEATNAPEGLVVATGTGGRVAA